MKFRYCLSRTLLSLVAITVLIVALRVPLLDIPFERDEGEYAYIAWRLDHGEFPYRDWFDQKPPAIFWVYRLALSFPFDAVRSVHLMGLAFALASAIGVFFLARRLLGESWGVAAALLFAVLAADPLVQGFAANTEIFMLLPMILGNVMYLHSVQDRRDDAALMFAVGILNGIAIAFKQVAVANWLFLVAVSPFMSTNPHRLRWMGTFAFLSALGITSFWGLVTWYFYANNALHDLVYNVFTHNVAYVRSIPFAERLSNLVNTLSTLAQSQALVWIFSLAGFIAACRSQRNASFVFVTGWLASGAVGASVSGYYFPHYFQQILPALAVLTVFGVKVLYDAKLWGVIPSWKKKAVCAIAVAIMPCYTLYPFVFMYTPQEAVREIYSGDRFDKMPEFAKVISTITKEDDRVFIFGAEPELLFYARRLSATRYIFLFPLYGHYGDALNRQQVTAREITAARPVVVVNIPNGLFFAPGTEQYFTRWTESFLARNYDAITFTSPDHDVFELYMIRQ